MTLDNGPKFTTKETLIESFSESLADGIDQMQNDGGIAPELPHRVERLQEIQASLNDGNNDDV